MKPFKRQISTFVLFFFLSFPAFAAKGIVSVRLESCDYFIVYVPVSDDFSLMEWHSGYDPEKGDVLYGNMNEYGLHNLYYGQRKTTVWIEEYGLERSDALDQLYEQCD